MSSRTFGHPRVEERKNVELPVALRVGPRSVSVAQASTVDLSQRGLRLRADFPLREGQGIQAIVNHGMKGARTYRVVWVHESGAGYPGYEVGLELLTETDSEGGI